MKPFGFALVTALIWGLVPLMEKSGLVKVAPYIGVYARSVGVLLGLAVYSFFVTPAEVLRALDLRSFLFLAGGGFLASFAAQYIFYHALKFGEASKMTAVAGIYPLITFFLALIFLGEAMTARKLAGVVLVVSGVALLR